MFGLMQSSELTATQSANSRRQVFHDYPNGAFPLMGLLSLMENREEVDKQTFNWFEDRHVFATGTTAQANSAGPFTDTDGASGAVGTDKTSGGWSGTANSTTVRIKLATGQVDRFRVDDIVRVHKANGTASSIKDFTIRITAVWTAQNTIDGTFIESVANILNSTANNGLTITSIGSAAMEGGYTKEGGYTFPIEPGNYTQIFKGAVGPFSRNALKMGQKFDKTGVYMEYATKAHLRIMELMEKATMFGVRNTTTATDAVDSKVKTIKTFGGIKWFLNEYELGTTGNGAHVTYRPGGSDITGSAWDASEEKRILKFSGGTVTRNEFDDIIRRAFLRCSNSSFEKLVVCGSKFLQVFNRFAEANSIKTVQLNSKEDTYGMSVTKWDSPWGTLYFKTHPVFIQHPILNNDAFIIDVGSLGYVPFQDSDLDLYKNRQDNSFDGRLDEWLGEFGLEVNFPERNLYIENLAGITQ
jgi:hypothetical protein